MHRAVAARDRADQEPVTDALPDGAQDVVPGAPQLRCRIRTYPVSDVVAMEKVHLVHGLAGRAQVSRQRPGGLIHVPMPGTLRLRAGFRLDAMNRADPV